MPRTDLAIVGAGILGLAHALAALRRGLKVVVIDREAEAVGASVRNFGFVAVTGQEPGECWRRAMRTRDVWDEIAPRAGIPIEQRGLLMVAQRPEAMACLEAFARTGTGQGCRLLTASATRAEHGAILAKTPVQGALWSPHERRVESRLAIAGLSAWLAAQGVEFLRCTLVHEVRPGRLFTSGGVIEAGRIVVCPGDDLLTLYPERMAARNISRCRLQMLKLMPARPFRLPAAVMSDQSLVRYPGYAMLPEAQPILARLRREQPRALAEGVHLIVVQGADGGLIVGDSHRTEWSPSPFQRDEVDELILAELRAVLDLADAKVIERWSGTYASAPDRLMFSEAIDETTRLVVVTSGTGASTGFAIGEETLEDLFGKH